MEFGECWFAKTCRTSLDDACDDAAYGVAVCLDIKDETLHFGCFSSIRAANIVGLYEAEVVLAVVTVEGYAAHLTGVGCDVDAELTESKFGKGSAYAARDGLTS